MKFLEEIATEQDKSDFLNFYTAINYKMFCEAPGQLKSSVGFEQRMESVK